MSLFHIDKYPPSSVLCARVAMKAQWGIRSLYFFACFLSAGSVLREAGKEQNICAVHRR